jgi:3-phenylpropionate/trans-cinnamate dioxygenase ferredoxin subunit
MKQYIRIATLADLVQDDVTTFVVNGQAIAVARVGNAIYALDDECSHSACPLSEGIIEGQNIICPCHGSEFDLKTGEALSLPADEPVACYAVKVEGEDVYVLL